MTNKRLIPLGRGVLGKARPGKSVVFALGQYHILRWEGKNLTFLNQGEFEALVWEQILQKYQETMIFNQRKQLNGKR